MGHRTFANKQIGERLRFDKGTPGVKGHKADSHWHRYSPEAKSKLDEYLDAKGVLVPRNSPDSHLYPVD